MGITKGVHTSTFTVHARDRNKFSSEEEIPLDNPGVYGLTKGIGERICGYFSREYGMSIAALRITGPRNTQDWIKDRNKPKDSPDHLWVTEESDLASAYSAACPPNFSRNSLSESTCPKRSDKATESMPGTKNPVSPSLTN